MASKSSDENSNEVIDNIKKALQKLSVKNAEMCFVQYETVNVCNKPKLDKNGRYKTARAKFYRVPYENGEYMTDDDFRKIFAQHQPDFTSENGMCMMLTYDTTRLLQRRTKFNKNVVGTVEDWFGQNGLYYELCAMPLLEAFALPIFGLVTDAGVSHATKCYVKKGKILCDLAHQDADDDQVVMQVAANAIRYDLPTHIYAGFSGLPMLGLHHIRALCHTVGSQMDNTIGQKHPMFDITSGDAMPTYVRQFRHLIDALLQKDMPEVACDFLKHMICVQDHVMSGRDQIGVPTKLAEDSFHVVGMLRAKKTYDLEELKMILSEVKTPELIAEGGMKMRIQTALTDKDYATAAGLMYELLRYLTEDYFSTESFYETFAIWAERLGFVTVLDIGGTSMMFWQNLSFSIRLWNSKGNKKITVYHAAHREAPYRYDTKRADSGHNGQAIDSIQKQFALDMYIEDIQKNANYIDIRSCSTYTAPHKPRPKNMTNKQWEDDSADPVNVTATSRLNKKTLKWEIKNSEERSVNTTDTFSRACWEMYKNTHLPHIPGGNSRMHDGKCYAQLMMLVIQYECKGI